VDGRMYIRRDKQMHVRTYETHFIRTVYLKTKARFSHLLQHPAWKWSGTILEVSKKGQKGKVKGTKR